MTTRPLVLLVEDSEPVRDAYTILLEESGYRVVSAGDGAAALHAAAAEPPDLAVVDLGLPGIDGLQVIRALRGAPGTAATVVVALTGRDEPEIRQQCLDAGCAAYLVKPIPTQHLLRTLAELR